MVTKFYTTTNAGHKHTYTSSGKITSFDSGHRHKIIMGKIQRHKTHTHNKTKRKVL